MSNQAAPAAADLAALLHRLERLERLERQNRWLKGVSAALFCLVSVGVLMGAKEAASPKAVTTEKFVLQDSNGKPRLMLASDPDQSGLIFYDATGRQACTLLVERDGAVLRFLQADGRMSSGISCERGGIGLVGIGDNGRRQTEVNAITVPGPVLLNAKPFTVKPEVASER